MPGLSRSKQSKSAQKGKKKIVRAVSSAKSYNLCSLRRTRQGPLSTFKSSGNKRKQTSKPGGRTSLSMIFPRTEFHAPIIHCSLGCDVFCDSSRSLDGLNLDQLDISALQHMHQSIVRRRLELLSQESRRKRARKKINEHEHPW
jgi:hypothetical protein